jgi:hypothetical protein
MSVVSAYPFLIKKESDESLIKVANIVPAPAGRPDIRGNSLLITEIGFKSNFPEET